MKFDSDIAVVGGGPAGLIAAARLADLGFRTTVFDSLKLKKRHRSESLSLEAFRFLEFLGVGQSVLGAVIRQTSRAVVHWADRTKERCITAFQLDRQRFDRELQHFAESRGAQICQPVRVSCVRHSGEGCGWKLMVEKAQVSHLHRTRFLVDAAGARDLIGVGRTPILSNTLSITGMWTSSMYEPVTYIEAMERGWCWFSPIRDDQWMATVFVDPTNVKAIFASALECYDNMIKGSRFFATLGLKSLRSCLTACSSTACRSQVVVGDDWIKVGDSAMSYDPLSSQGIHCAMTNAYQSAVVIKTILRSKNARLAKLFYTQQAERRVREHVRNTTRLCCEQSNVCSGEFWNRCDSQFVEAQFRESPRGISLTEKLQISQSASLGELPMLNTDEIVAETGLFIEGRDPISRFEGAPIKQLMALIDGSRSGADLLSVWSQEFSPLLARRFLDYLVSHRGVVAKV